MLMTPPRARVGDQRAEQEEVGARREGNRTALAGSKPPNPAAAAAHVPRHEQRQHEKKPPRIADHETQLSSSSVRSIRRPTDRIATHSRNVADADAVDDIRVGRAASRR